MDYICHYGVKGMKWGVRRTPEQLGHPYSRRSAKDRILSSKQSLWRVTSDPKETKTRRGDLGNFTYVTTNKRDRNEYRFSDHFNNGNMYEHELRPISPLKIAGGKKVVETILETSGKKQLAAELKNSHIATDRTLEKWVNKNLSNVYIPNYGRYRKTKDNYDWLHDVAGPKLDLVNEENVQRGKKVIDSLKAQGYDGMVDVTDRYSWETMDPTIIFDRKKLKTKKVTDVRDFY